MDMGGYTDLGENMGIYHEHGCGDYYLKDFSADRDMMILDYAGNFYGQPEEIFQLSEDDMELLKHERAAMFSLLSRTAGYDFYIGKFYNGNAIVEWMVQPEERYWDIDEDFGSAPDGEIYLYSLINRQGLFIRPFQIFKNYDEAKKHLLHSNKL